MAGQVHVCKTRMGSFEMKGPKAGDWEGVRVPAFVKVFWAPQVKSRPDPFSPASSSVSWASTVSSFAQQTLLETPPVPALDWVPSPGSLAVARGT